MPIMEEGSSKSNCLAPKKQICKTCSEDTHQKDPQVVLCKSLA